MTTSIAVPEILLLRWSRVKSSKRRLLLRNVMQAIAKMKLLRRSQILICSYSGLFQLVVPPKPRVPPQADRRKQTWNEPRMLCAMLQHHSVLGYDSNAISKGILDETSVLVAGEQVRLGLRSKRFCRARRMHAS